MENIKEEFISTLSHEIRTPLTSIKGFSKTLLSSWDMLDDNKKKEFLKIILDQSQRLINLCENVLNVAKIDSNTAELVLVKADINSIVKNCSNIISVNHKEFDFNLDLAKGELFCYVDADKTQQIIINLLDNAAKYSIDSKKVEIKTSNTENFGVVSIKNYGSYIEKEDQKHIFEKFYRADSYLKSTAQGSGLGLYIVQNLVKKMQGKIEVKSSKETLETEFILYLPFWEAEKEIKRVV